MNSYKRTEKVICSVCNITPACVLVEVEVTKHHLCLLHFSLFDQDIPTSSKKSSLKEHSLKSKIIDQKEHSLQAVDVKNMWKQATADVVLTMFEYEKEEQKQARIAQVPIAIPRTRKPLIPSVRPTGGPPDDSADIIPKERSADIKKEDSSDIKKKSSIVAAAAAMTAPSYAWKRGSVAGATEDRIERKDESQNVKKRSISTSLWRTGLQQQSKEEILEEAERILELDRINAQGEPCTTCASRLTFSHNLVNHDISKNETWGSKDVNNMTARVECRECKNIWTVFTE